MVDELQVGVITGTHGIRGLVKVLPVTDDPARFSRIEKVNAVMPDGSRRELFITQARMHKGAVLLGFKGLEDINLVEKLKGAELFVERQDAAPLKENEYYYADLVGMDVIRVDEEGEKPLGTLTDVMETGPNQVFVISKTDGKELLIPSIRDCILDVDIGRSVMKVRLLAGMEA